MKKVLPIKPFTRPVQGTVQLPGSKSLTNRALILAALSEGTVRLEHTLFSEDTRIMITALRRLGFVVKDNETAGTVEIVGRGGIIPIAKADIEVGNAGTAARFLPALLSLSERGTYTVDGSKAMRRRPIKGLLDALTALGARVVYNGEPGYFPFTLHTQGLQGDSVELDASASSQILSALCMVAPHIRPERSENPPFTITLQGETVSKPFVRMTLEVLRQFGRENREVPKGASYQVSRAKRRPHSSGMSSQQKPYIYTIEPDLTAASYFLALPKVVGGALLLKGVKLKGSLQGDGGFATLLQDAGLVELEPKSEGLLVRGGPKHQGVDRDFNAISDTFLTLAAMAPLLEGPTMIRGIGHTRKQETDRVAAVAKELQRLGQSVQEEASSLEIIPSPLVPSVIQTYKDHRVAMSFGILGCRDINGNARPWLTIEDPDCCAKTFPHFFEVLDDLYSQAHSD